MTLTLHIENETSLADGGPLSVSIKGKRGLDIGRDPYLDWTLPDPNAASTLDAIPILTGRCRTRAVSFPDGIARCAGTTALIGSTTFQLTARF